MKIHREVTNVNFPSGLARSLEDYTMSEELNVVIPNSTLDHIDAHKITTSDFITMYKAVNSSKELRYYAKEHEVEWQEVKEKFTATNCLFCVENNQMYVSKRIYQCKSACRCLFCPWIIFEGMKCNNYTDHDKAIERYTKWMAMLDKLIKARS